MTYEQSAVSVGRLWSRSEPWRMIGWGGSYKKKQKTTLWVEGRALERGQTWGGIEGLRSSKCFSSTLLLGGFRRTPEGLVVKEGGSLEEGGVCVLSSQDWNYTMGDRKPLTILNQSLAGSWLFFRDNSVHSGKNGPMVGKIDSMKHEGRLRNCWVEGS